MELSTIKAKYNLNNLRIPQAPVIDLRHRPDVKKLIEQKILSQSQLWIARHIGRLTNIGIYNDPDPDYRSQKPIIEQIVLEFSFCSPLHNNQPYRADIFLPKAIFVDAPDTLLEIDGDIYHQSEEQKIKDKFKDEVAKRVYGFRTFRYLLQIPQSLKYGHITNPKNLEYVKNRYQQGYLKEVAREIIQVLNIF